jgi:hypothetical protein
MTAALQLVCDYGFEGAGLRLIRWRAGWQLGVATCRGEGRLGLLWCCPGFAGAARRAAPRLDRHIGPRRSPGAAALAAPDQDARHWCPTAGLPRLRCRPHRRSLLRPGTAYWLVSMPRPYERHNALAYFESIGELAARCAGMAWCIADPRDDRCLGSVSLDGLDGYAKRGTTGRRPAGRPRPLLLPVALWRSAEAATYAERFAPCCGKICG